MNQIKNVAAIAHALAEADANQVSYKYLELAANQIRNFRRNLAERDLLMEYMSSSIPGKVMWIISFLKSVERLGAHRNIFD